MSQQGLRQASVRAVTGMALDYNGDWHALFDKAGIAPGAFEGRLLTWINLKLGVPYTDVEAAMAAFAAANNATTFSAVGSFDASLFEPETTALLSRMTVTPDATRQGQYNTLIKSLKASTVWTKLDCLYVTAAHDAQAARLNLKQALYNLTPINSPTFTVDRGYQGDGTMAELATGYDPSVSSLGVAQDSAHVGTFAAIGSSSVGGYDVGADNFRLRVSNRTGTAAGGSVSTNTLITATDSTGSYPQHMVAVRRDSANQILFRNAVQVTTMAAASLGLPSAMRILRNTTTYLPAGRNVAAVHIGPALSDAELLALYSAVLTYMQAVGAA